MPGGVIRFQVRCTKKGNLHVSNEKMAEKSMHHEALLAGSLGKWSHDQLSKMVVFLHENNTKQHNFNIF
jgi:hypothetical protein